jgi:hypothetical protein
MKRLLRLWPWRVLILSGTFWPAWWYLPDQRVMLSVGYAQALAACFAAHSHRMASHIKRPPRAEEPNDKP